MEDNSGMSRNIVLGVVLLLLVLGGGFYYWETEVRSDEIYDDYSVDEGDTSTQAAYTTAASSTVDFMTFTQNTAGFSIDYPTAWELDTTSTLVPAAFYSPLSSDSDLFQDNVNVTTEDPLSYGEISLDDYAAAGLENIKTSLPEYTLVEQGTRTFGQGNYEGAYLLGDYVVPEIALKIYSLFTIVDGTAYVVTYSYDLTDQALYQAEVDTMMDSFKVL